MPEPAIQDYYPDDVAHCFGCGRLNEAGHQFKTRWDGDQTVTEFTPDRKLTAVPGFVYGGLVASLVDCHGTGSGALAGCRAEGRDFVAEGSLRYVTGSLEVKYLKPTPMGVPLVARGTMEEVKGRKVVVSVSVTAGDVEVATGRVITIQMPDTMAGGKA